MNTTSMLDVIFILLIFFIAVSKLREARIDLRLPEADGPATAASETPPVTLAVDASDGLHLNGRKVGDVAELVRLLKDHPKDQPVSVLADRGSHSGRLVEALRAVNEAGFTRVSFAYEPKGDAP